MNQNPVVKKRAWVKNAAIIFLAVLLVLTFFSNTIMNWSLPEVSGQYAGYGTISTSIRGSGTVEANLDYSVQISETRQIKSVKVRKGDAVEAGEVLFVLEPSASAELQTEIDTLEELQYNYNLRLLDLTTPDYAENNQSITDKRQEIADAEKQLSELSDVKKDYDAAVNKRDTIQKHIDEINDQIENVNNNITDVAENAAESSPTIARLVSDLESLKTALKNANTDLAGKKTAYDNYASKITTSVEAANEQYQTVKRAYDEMLKEYNNAKADYDALVKAKNEYDKQLAAFSSLAAKLQSAADAKSVAQDEADNCKAEYDALIEANAPQSKIDELKQKSDDASIKATSLKLLYEKYVASGDTEKANTAKSDADNAEALAQALLMEYNKAVKARNDYIAGEECKAASEKLNAAKTKLSKAETDYNEVKKQYDSVSDALTNLQKVTNAEITSAARQLDSQKTNLTYKEQELSKATEVKTTAVSQSAELSKLKTSMDKAQTNVDRYQTAVDNTQDSLNDAVSSQTKTLKKQLSSLKKQLRDESELLKNAEADVTNYTSKLTITPEELEANIKNANKELASLISTLAKQKETDAKELEKTNLSLKKDKDAIDTQAAKVEKMRGKSEGENVTAKYAGTVTAINCVAGDTASAGVTLANIDVEGKGYTVSIPVTNAQSQQVHIGDTATVTDYWWGNVSVILQAVKSDASNPGKGKLLEFSVTGDVDVGQNLTLSVGEKTNSYNCVVPNSAVREDKDGKFVLISAAKSTPLGNRYYAKRVNVTVAAKDTVNSAIDTGDQYFYEFVITSSTAPVEEGALVRMAGNK